MTKEFAKEYFFLNLGGRIDADWPDYEPGRRLTVVKKKVERKTVMYVVGPCNIRVYFDTMAVRKLLRMEAEGVFYNCHYVSWRGDGILHVLMCRVGGMFHPEDILL